MQLRFVLPLLLIFPNALAFAELKSSNFIVEIAAKTARERTEIAKHIHLDSVTQDRVFSVVNRTDLESLARDPNVVIVSTEAIEETKGLSDYYHPFVGAIDFPAEDSAFHTYDEALAALTELAHTHESLVELFSIGKSIEGRDIWAIKITDDSEPKENKKGVAYMGTHHAREHVSTEIPIMFAKDFLARLDTEPEFRELIKNIEIYIIPLVNPDGAIHDIVDQRYKWWRKNRRVNRGGSFGVDLNRNYGYGWGTGGSSSNPSSDIYMGTAAFSEPETQAIRDFFVAHSNITVALSFHTFSELVLYPWGGKNNGVGGDDERLFKKMAADMAAINHYTPMQSSQLYIASGDTCDWLYGQLKVYCFTFELSPASMFDGGFYPGASVLDQVYDDNVDAILYLAKAAHDPRSVLR